VIAPYRIPFDLDNQWNIVGKANWDDPHIDPTYRHGEYEYDFGFPEGFLIRAARSGVVIAAVGDRLVGDGTGGNFIFIRHPDGMVSDYAHLQTNSVLVNPGDWVAQGQAIAGAGTTGVSTDTHLHFQVMAYANSETDFGPTLPIMFLDSNHVAWRPVSDEVLVPNNTRHRQENWRYCHKCKGLFFGGVTDPRKEVGVCKAGDGHDASSSDSYVLTLDAHSSSGQKNWRHCSRCQLLFFGGNPQSDCPAPGGGPHDGTGSGDYNAPPENAPHAQDGWRWCHKCQGIFYSFVAGSQCSTGGPHEEKDSGKYGFVRQIPTIGQGNWRRCAKCAGLFFPQRGSVCPADNGEHEQVATDYYALVYDLSPTITPAELRLGGQSDWRFCRRCKGLFFGGPKRSRCPADGRSPHDDSGSGNYRLMDADLGPGQSGWRWCNRCQGLFYALAGWSRCPAPGGGAHATADSGNYRLLARVP
jgi:hypothetical protein